MHPQQQESTAQQSLLANHTILEHSANSAHVPEGDRCLNESQTDIETASRELEMPISPLLQHENSIDQLSSRSFHNLEIAEGSNGTGVGIQHEQNASDAAALQLSQPSQHLQTLQPLLNHESTIRTSNYSSQVLQNVENYDENWTGIERAKQPPVVHNKLTFVARAGKYFLFVLIASPILILASTGFLAFLWFGSGHNSTWHKFVIRNWITNVVTICSEIIKQAITFQVGTAGAMLAALSLERYEVLFPHAAEFTYIRAGSEAGSLLSLAKIRLMSAKRIGMRHRTIPLLLVMMATTFLLSQVITILLVSDIGLSLVPGATLSRLTPIGFKWSLDEVGNSMSNVHYQESSWFRQASVYPTFAEYSESPYIAEGVSDTGLTLRAFLPFQEAQKRETLQVYKGKTTVLDSRVTCQVPTLSGELIKLGTDGDDRLIFVANVSASKVTPRLGNSGPSYLESSKTNYNVNNISIPVSCTYSIEGYSDQWSTTICELEEPGPGGLVSEFKDLGTWNTSFLSGSGLYGKGYLLLNGTKGSYGSWRAILETGDVGNERPPAYSLNGEWLDLVYSDGTLILSATLCYAAFDIADIPIKISSTSNRTETTPVFDFNEGKYTFGALRRQYNQFRNETDEERRILSLSKQDWITSGNDSDDNDAQSVVGDNGPYVRILASLGNVGATMSNDSSSQVDLMHIRLFQEIITTGGSVAFALQSLITLLSSMAYYDQIRQFDKIEPVLQTFYVLANTPQRATGFIVVTVVLVVHLTVLWWIVIMFARETQFSLLNNAWTGLSQANSGDLKSVIDSAALLTDQTIETCMKDNLRMSRVGVRAMGHNSVGITFKKSQG